MLLMIDVDNEWYLQVQAPRTMLTNHAPTAYWSNFQNDLSRYELVRILQVEISN